MRGCITFQYVSIRTLSWCHIHASQILSIFCTEAIHHFKCLQSHFSIRKKKVKSPIRHPVSCQLRERRFAGICMEQIQEKRKSLVCAQVFFPICTRLELTGPKLPPDWGGTVSIWAAEEAVSLDRNQQTGGCSSVSLRQPPTWGYGMRYYVRVFHRNRASRHCCCAGFW